MGTISINRLGGLSLIVGPVLALVFFFMAPGQMLVEQTDPTDTAGFVKVMQDNALLTHLTSFVIPLGLVMMLFGFYALQGLVRTGGNGDSLSRLGITFLFFGVIGWVMSSGMGHIVANTDNTDIAKSVFQASGGFNIVGNLAGALGFLAFSLAISTRDDFNKNMAIIAALASGVLLITTVIGTSDNTQANTMGMIGGISYIVVAAWSVMIGMAIHKKG